MELEVKDFSIAGRPVPANFEVRVRVAWWVKPYLHLTFALHSLFGTIPNYDVVSADIQRGITMKLERVGAS